MSIPPSDSVADGITETPREQSVPSFAVVGHPNKGKSSIVATLAEEDDIAVSPVPGTTRQSRRFALAVDGQTLYELIDTPGFQRSRELLAWLEAHETSAASRVQLVADFVEAHAADARFQDECQLLRPIVDGAGILYVVDGTKPYGGEYEIEMEILRWTGRPRMALINLIGEGDYIAQWRAALGQYFSIVREFDAMHADFDRRVDLLRGFAELDENWKQPLRDAVATLLEERERRLMLSAQEIAGCLVTVTTATQTRRLGEEEDADAHKPALETKLKSNVSKREAHCRRQVEDLYRHFRLERTDTATEMMATDLFASESWQVFGLSRQQLLVTGAISGAVAGSGVDLVLGGASLMLGAGIGAAIGSASAWFGATELAKTKVLGQSLGGRVLQVGPVQDPNFPWVVLGRAWLHHRLVSERNHARREAMALDAQLAKHQMDSIDGALRRRLQTLVSKIANGSAASDAQAQLADAVADVLRTPVVG